MDLEWTELMPSDVEVLPKYRKRVQEREAKGLCIANPEDENGDRHECDSPVHARGLCVNCHYRFRMDRLGTPKTKKRLYENDRIRRGTLLPNRQGQRIKRLRKAS